MTKESNSVLAWHFTRNALRDGSPIPRHGKWLKHDGELRMCQSGLHASRSPFDALRYAPGAMLHRVKCGGTIVEDDAKLVCSQRRILKTRDATQLLRQFARDQALSVIHLWDAPRVVVDYLESGDMELRSAARSAAWSATRSAALSAAWLAARSAAESATLSAAWSAAWSAARSAARSAAELAARLAAESAARSDFNQRVYLLFDVEAED